MQKEAGREPLGQVCDALAVNGALDRSDPTSRCLGVHVAPEAAPGFWSPVDVKAVGWSDTLKRPNNRAYGDDGRFATECCVASVNAMSKC